MCVTPTYTISGVYRLVKLPEHLADPITQEFEIPSSSLPTIMLFTTGTLALNWLLKSGFISGFHSRGGKRIMVNFKRGQIQIQGGATLY